MNSQSWYREESLQPVFLSGLGDCWGCSGQALRQQLGATPAPAAPSLPDVPGRLSTGGYVAASMVGATLGGGLIGYVSSRDRSGALSGAGFCVSMAAVSDAFLLSREDQPVAAAVLASLGLLGLSWTFLRFRGQSASRRSLGRLRR